jgi:hypothetical protein
MTTEPPVVGVLRRIDPVLAGLRGVRVERLRHNADAIALFDRCVGLHHAICHLVAGHYAHEAAVLTRPLMTDSMFLTDIAAGDERYRAEALVGWELSTIADWEGIIKEGLARGQGDGSELAVFDRRRQWLGKYREGTGLFKAGEMPRHRKPDGDVKRIADAHGRGDEYLDYRTMQHFVHGSTFAVHARYARSVIEDQADGLVEIGGTAADLQPYREAVLLLSARAVLYAARATYVLLDIQEPDEIGALLAEIDRLADENNRASASSAASG